VKDLPCKGHSDSRPAPSDWTRKSRGWSGEQGRNQSQNR